MTKEQAFEEIISEHKWYIGHYSQSHASQLIQRFKAGMLKDKTINSLLHKFGYELKEPEQWAKK